MSEHQEFGEVVALAAPPKQPSQNEANFEQLVHAHHRTMLAFARSLVGRADVAEDLVQDAFVVVYERLETFDVSRDFGKWMRGIVRNKYREWARARRERALDHDMLDAISSVYAAWKKEDVEEKGNLLSRLHRCIELLAEMPRKAIKLFYLQNQSCAAIASVTSSNETTIKKRLQRGREALAACLNNSTASGEDVI
jgi:RNA polymerase sigma factor (sigma-70 family)